MRPKIIEARTILETGVNEVRTMQWVALASLLVNCIVTVVLNASTSNGVIFTAILLLAIWQALLKKDDITRTFRDECGEEWATGDTPISKLVVNFFVPWRRSLLARLCGCGRAGASRPRVVTGVPLT